MSDFFEVVDVRSKSLWIDRQMDRDYVELKGDDLHIIIMKNRTILVHYDENGVSAAEEIDLVEYLRGLFDEQI